MFALMATTVSLKAYALEPMLPKPANISADSSKHKVLKGGVSESKSKNGTNANATLQASVTNNHQYYVMFTSNTQVSRGDFDNSKISIRGNRGAVFTTNGRSLKVLAGHVLLENESSTSVHMMSEFGTLAVQPNSAIEIYRVGDRDEIVVKQGNLTVEQAAQPLTLKTGDFMTRDGQCTFKADAVEERPVGVSTKNSIFTEPLRAWASEGSEFGITPLGTVELLKGECVFSSSQPVKIKTMCGSIESNDPNIIAVRVLTTGFFVESCAIRRTLKVASHGHNLSLKGGESCILVNGAPEEAPEDGIGRRLCTSAFDGYMTAFRSEFSMVSLIKKLDSLYAAYKEPATPHEKRFMQSWVKAIACLDIVQADREDYSTTPKILQKGRLGNFVNPFLSVQPAGADVSGFNTSVNN